MSWTSLFLSAKGRIGRKDFWVAKRLHDIGKSGWLAGVVSGLGVVVGLAAGMVEALRGQDSGVAVVIPLIVALVAFLCAIAGLALFLGWGLKRGDAVANAYGEPQASVLTRFGPAAANP